MTTNWQQGPTGPTRSPLSTTRGRLQLAIAAMIFVTLILIAVIVISIAKRPETQTSAAGVAASTGTTQEQLRTTTARTTSARTTTTPRTTTPTTPPPPTPAELFQAALAAAGLTYSTEVGLTVCETVRAGGLPPLGTSFPGRTAPQYLVENEQVGTGSPNGLAVELAIRNLCPDQIPTLDQALSGNYPLAMLASFGDGNFRVGYTIAAGTYQTVAAGGGLITDCYWERTDGNGNIIENNFVTAAPQITVTVRESDASFTSQGCGLWNLLP